MRAIAAPGWRFDEVETIASTSDALIERAAAGEEGRAALLARRQTRARGSRGRTWVAPDGNLAMSVLLRPSWPAAETGRCVFVAGLAFRAALQAWAADAVLSLKWPNDVLLDGRKLGGVLVETSCGPADRVEWLVIGFGANLLSAPSVPGRSTACLAEAGVPPDPAVLGARLLGELDAWFETLDRSGFDAVRSAWLDAAHPEGTRLVAEGVEGAFAGLSAQGDLLLRSGDTTTAVRTGQVMLAGR